MFALGRALEFAVDETGVTIEAAPARGAPGAGLRIARNGSVSVWEALPSSNMIGAVLDEGHFRRQVARDLRLIAALDVLETDSVAVAVGINDVTMLGVPSGSGMSLPFAAGGERAVHLEPSDAWPASGLAQGADDIARELVARLVLRLGRR